MEAKRKRPRRRVIKKFVYAYERERKTEQQRPKAPPRGKRLWHPSVRRRRSEASKKAWREHREALMAGQEKRRGKLSTTRTGIPTGMRRAQAEAAWVEARKQADEVFQELVTQGMIDNIKPDDFEKVAVENEAGQTVDVFVPKTDEGKAALALKEAMVEVLVPFTDRKARLAAIRTVLEWTKSKPVQKVSAELTKAEDFLALIAADAAKVDKAD